MAGVYLTVTSTAPHARDLGYLLHKHPDNLHRTEVSGGVAYVFYPRATDTETTAALLVEIDPIGLVRSKRFRGDGFSLGQYVNDRPYAASSLLAVALGRVFRTAMSGRCAQRPDLEGAELPLRIEVPSVRSSGGPELVHALFEPLGWQLRTRPEPLDPVLGWGDSRYVATTLTATTSVAAALNQLYVLLPALDGAKHYWVSDDEVDKLVRAGTGWLEAHPERGRIMARYLAFQRRYVTTAAERLRSADDQPDAEEADAGVEAVDPCTDDAADAADAAEDPEDQPAQQPAEPGPAGGEPTEQPIEPRTPLNVQRRERVLAELRDLGARRVIDLGCGSGALLRLLLRDPEFTEVVGADVSAGELVRAEQRLRLDRLPDRVRARIRLLQSSVSYRDDRLAGYDAIVLMEVVEHVDADRLPSLEYAVFGAARPAHVLVSTPNAEYNVRYPSLAPGAFRHPDHRFEWSRAEFAEWAQRVGVAYGYVVRLDGVGELDPDLGRPSQLAVFTRTNGAGTTEAGGSDGTDSAAADSARGGEAG